RYPRGSHEKASVTKRRYNEGAFEVDSSDQSRRHPDQPRGRVVQNEICHGNEGRQYSYFQGARSCDHTSSEKEGWNCSDARGLIVRLRVYYVRRPSKRDLSFTISP